MIDPEAEITVTNLNHSISMVICAASHRPSGPLNFQIRYLSGLPDAFPGTGSRYPEKPGLPL
jgi:hypothetical protein